MISNTPRKQQPKPRRRSMLRMSNFLHLAAPPQALLLLLLLLVAAAVGAALALNEPTASSEAQKQLCPKGWIPVGQKCFRIYNSPRVYASAKSRCSDMTAHLAVVEDESAAAEREPTSTGASILAYLASSDPNRADLQARQYYVSPSAELLAQYTDTRHQNGYQGPNSEHNGESEVPVSDLWLLHDDPALANLTSNLPQDRNDNNTAFILAYSKKYKRWGILPVANSRKMSFICERQVANQSSTQQTATTSVTAANGARSTPSPALPPSTGSAVEQAQSVDQLNAADPKRLGDLNNQSSNSRHLSVSLTLNSHRSNLDQSLSGPKETPPAAQDTSSMLFREFPQDQSVVMGLTAEMRCVPLESDISHIVWSFNNYNLTQTNRIKLFQNGSLRIEQVRTSDDGNYTCTIISGGTAESRSARLEILEKPHQPEYINAELLDKQSNSVKVKWIPGDNGNSPILGYTVEMRTINSDFVSESELNSIIFSNLWETARANISADQTSVIIGDLKPAKRYIFRIKATNRFGTSEPSLPTRNPIEVPVQPPNMPPENLNGSPKTSNSIYLQWSPPPPDSHNGPLKGYKIRYKLAGYASDSIWYTSDVTDPGRVNFVLDDLIVWQTYEIQVAAENDKGVGPYSSSISIRTKEGKPEKGPRSVSADAVTSKSIIIKWNPPPPKHINGYNQGYKIQIWQDLAHTKLVKELIAPHSIVSPFHSITVDGLLPYTDYHITIKCFTSAGEGPPNDDIIVVRTKPDLPEAVESLEFIDVLDKSLKAIWRPPVRSNGELDHYLLEYSESPTFEQKISRSFRPTVTEAKINDLTPQTSYHFRVYSYTSVGQGPPAVATIKTKVPPVLPEAPTNLIQSEVGAYSAVIQFNPGFDGNATIDKWIVEALTPARDVYGSRWQTIYESTNHSSSDNSLTVRNLRPFTKYRVRLIAVNIVGSSPPSDASPEFQTSQIEPEQPPRDLIVEDIKSNSSTVHWSPLANNLWNGIPLGYNLTWTEADTSITNFHVIDNTHTSSYFIGDLREYVEYTFKIYAINQAGSSPPSESVVITTLEGIPSAPPTNLTAHALSSHAISIDWGYVPKKYRNGLIRGYIIQYKPLESKEPIKDKIIDDNSTKHFTLNQLKPFTTYQLAVAAFTSIGNGTFSSMLQAQTFEDTPGPIQNLSNPTVSQTAVRILWDPPESPNGEILGYKVTYYIILGEHDAPKEVATNELHSTERTFKATDLKPETNYIFTVTAKTKEGWGQQSSIILHTHDSVLRASLPFFRESWFVILCFCSSFVITIVVTACLFIQTKSQNYKQDTIKSTSRDRLGDTGFSIDDDLNNNGHYNNGFGMLSQVGAQHRRSEGAASQSTANFTLPKTPPRPQPGSVVYSDDGDDDVFEDVVDKTAVKSTAGTSNYDSSGDSVTEKPSEISSSTTEPQSESGDDEYVNMANKHFVNHYANVNGTLRGQKSWRKNSKAYASHKAKPKLPQRPAPSVPKIPGDMASSGSDNPQPGTSGMQSAMRPSVSIYGEHSAAPPPPKPDKLSLPQDMNNLNDLNNNNASKMNNHHAQTADLLNGHMVNLNGGRIIVDNMAGSRAPLPGFTSFV